MQLPQSSKVDSSRLASVFNETTNSYKFYWFLAILDELSETGQSSLRMRNLSLRMLALVWYPLDYFKLSFGKQDGFKKLADFLSTCIEIDNRPSAPGLFEQITQKLTGTDLKLLNPELDTLLRWVPYRFIRPFFTVELSCEKDHKVNGRIAELASTSSHAPYSFNGEFIEVNESWVQYFQQHKYILQGFTYWHLLRFVQKNNPNVIGLSEKLIKPGERDFKIAKKFWKEYLDEKGPLSCIYSGQLVTSANMSLDHFLPWSYVAHDQVWNIIPTPKAVNSAKSDWLPSLELYFDAYALVQYHAFQFHAHKGHNKLLEDYSCIFLKSIEFSQQQSFEWFKLRLEQQFLPQIQTAQNLGFAHPFIFRESKNS